MEPVFGRVTVVGAGLMGHAIALVHALGGCQVVMNDLSEDRLRVAQRHVRGAADTLVSAGMIAGDAAEAALRRITVEAGLEAALQPAELVVEAISEDVEAKRAVFAAIDRFAPPDAVLASNTSYLDIFPLVPEARLPRTLILHWYTPPYLIDLVDVVASTEAAPELVEKVTGFLRELGKKPVVFNKFVQGYVANRLQAAIALEIYALLDGGYTTPEDVDTSIRYGIAERMIFLGHLMKCDFSGIALTQKSLSNKPYHPPEVRGRADVIDGLVAQGRTGIMSGKGFFDYGNRTPEDLMAERDRKLIALKAAVKEIEAKASFAQ